MAKRTKVAAPQLPVPQSDVEAAAAVARIGVLMRELDRIKAAGEDQVAAIAADVNATSAPLRAKLKAETEGLRTFCEANRGRLTLAQLRESAALVGQASMLLSLLAPHEAAVRVLVAAGPHPAAAPAPAREAAAP